MNTETKSDVAAELPPVIYLPDLSSAAPCPPKRRRVTDPKDCVVAFRCTPAEYDRICASAADAGLELGAYLRQRETGKPEPRARRARGGDTLLLAKVLAQMGKSGSNLNQIARQLNRDDVVQLAELREAIADHRAVCEAIMRALGV